MHLQWTWLLHLQYHCSILIFKLVEIAIVLFNRFLTSICNSNNVLLVFNASAMSLAPFGPILLAYFIFQDFTMS